MSVSDQAEWQTHPWVTEGNGQIRIGGGVTMRAELSDWEERADLVQAMEDLGYDSYWVPDHPPIMMDPWSVLSAVAVVTKRIRLGPMVDCVYHRSPPMRARLVADVDRLSNGRTILGLGIGWAEQEFKWLGMPFPAVPERNQALREAIEITWRLWRDETFAYHGKVYQYEETKTLYGPLQQPRVPILIAGGGEHVTLRQVARYADAANIQATSAATAEAVVHKFAVLRRHCEALGRPYDSVLRTYFLNPLIIAESQSALNDKLSRLAPGQQWTGPGMFAGTIADIIARLRPLVGAGVQYFVANFSRYDDVETARLFHDKVLPELQVG
jgi:alkanesulfonate monooxygenase SsuD/methylene tetrahydromethanopterin reductase-like flavin-dependent oxidoreductase (luciferase family)